MFIPPLPILGILARSPSPFLDETFGAVLIGTFFSLMLYGVTLHQAYRYYLMYSTDRLLLKFAVYSTIILETAHMALSCHTSYFYLVSNYTNPSALQYPIRTLQILPILTGLVIGISQAFFARRAFLFGKRYRIWVFLAMFFLVGEFGFCVVSTIVEIFLTSRGFSAFVPHTWVIATASAMAVCADFILTTVLIIALRQSRSGQPRTDSTLDVLVLYTITTGLLTSVSMLILFLFVVLRPADLIYTGISLVSTKLYANALLAALNSRKSLRDQTYDGADQATFSIQFLEGTSTQGQQSSRMAFDQSVVIELPELPKRLCGQYAMGVKDCGKCSWPEGPTEAEGQCSYLGRGAPSGRQSPFGTQDGSPPLPKREA